VEFATTQTEDIFTASDTNNHNKKKIYFIALSCKNTRSQ